MVAYAYDTIARRNPLASGMVHVVGGTSVAWPRCRDQIQKPLRLPDAAFSYLCSHGMLDREHNGAFRVLDGPHRRPAGPGGHRPRARLLPPVRRRIPRLPCAAAGAAGKPCEVSR
jgi:hypothetical protein